MLMERVTVYTNYEDGSKPRGFDGVLTGKDEEPQPPLFPMLISSLRTNSIDEDLICYDNGTYPDNASSYIYKWIVDGESFAYILLPFDTEDAATAQDYSGNGYNGTVHGPTWSDQGKVGGCYYFGGASDYITMDVPGFFTDISNNDFTISLWLNSANISHDHRVALLAGDGDNFATLFQFGNEIHFGVYEDGVRRAVRSENLSSDTWYHIVGVWDASEDSLAVYVDGVLNHEIGYRNYPLGSQPGFDIGHGTASSRFWYGFVDEVQLYDRALSEDQIYQMYRCINDGCVTERVIASEETNVGDSWQCMVIPNYVTFEDPAIESNTLQIVNYSGGG